MCSSSPKAPKSQLAAEQPSTEGHWNPPKNDSPHPQTEEKPHQDRERGGRRGTITIKSIPCLPNGWPPNWRTVITKKFSRSCKDLEPYVRLPSLRIQQRNVHYKLALAKAFSSEWATTRASSICLCGGWSLCCCSCWPATPLEFRVEWGPLCSRETGTTGL